MPSPRNNLFWPLRLIAAISLLAPTVLFTFATWENHRTIDARANERIDQALDVLQEHALKAFQTVERSISEVNEVLRGLSDEQIRAAESDVFLRLKRTQQALPQIEAIWAFNADGHPLVSSTILPVPRELNNSDRSYFRAHKESDAGTYIGEVVRARIGSLRFFVVSGRRMPEQAGRFEGVIGVTVMPDHFGEFYRKLSRGRDTFAMLRADGLLLARFPEMRLEESPPAGHVSREIRSFPESGMLTAKSSVDGVERRVGYRRVQGFPIYVTAGIETAALRDEFWSTLLLRLAFGMPVTLGVFALSLYALRRTQRFHEEIQRREAAETALKQAQRLEAIGQLTGGVAHDFNNLLMVVGGNADAMRRHGPTDERSRRALDAIATAVKRGSELTRQLLSFSRRQTHEARVIDLRERLPVIQTMLQSSLRGDIIVRTDIADNVWRTRVDLSEFELAMLNLAVNARDAMGAGGNLTIAVRNLVLRRPNTLDLEGEFVAVGVRDTGTGIPADALARVFEPFFTTKDVGKGTGLGLSQVYGFAQQAGGTATIDSEPGLGTTVTLYLPRSTESVNTDTPEAAPAVRLPPPQEHAHVLLVEDNADVAAVTRGLLEERGYSVLHVSDVASAMGALKAEGGSIDVVLSDIVMPGGLNGLDLARWVRDARNGLPPIVLATGYSDRAQSAADDGYTILRKPYDGETLREALATALRRHSETGAKPGQDDNGPSRTLD